LMMKHILKCTLCGNYGLDEECSCGSKRVSPRPARFSPDDKYAHYRRIAKRMIEDKGVNADNDVIADNNSIADKSLEGR